MSDSSAPRAGGSKSTSGASDLLGTAEMAGVGISAGSIVTIDVVGGVGTGRSWLKEDGRISEPGRPSDAVGSRVGWDWLNGSSIVAMRAFKLPDGGDGGAGRSRAGRLRVGLGKSSGSKNGANDWTGGVGAIGDTGAIIVFGPFGSGPRDNAGNSRSPFGRLPRRKASAATKRRAKFLSAKPVGLSDSSSRPLDASSS